MPNRSTHLTVLRQELTSERRLSLLGVAAAMGCALVLGGCNTTAGVGKDVSATGAAVTRGANDVKTGL